MEGEKSRNPAAGAICVLPEIKPSGNPAVSISITHNIPLSAVPEAQIFMSAEPAVCVQKKRICRQKADLLSSEIFWRTPVRPRRG
jgi:hypothetical protein